MTINFKPGLHPDADQLSAFIEQALPAHERDGVLAHLAVCAECRGVVALALPEVPVPAFEPRKSSIGKSWFSNWMVVLPAATAVAALAAFIFFVHRESPAPQQQAQVETAPAPAPPNHLQTASQTAPAADLKTAPAAKQAVPHAIRHEAEIARAANGSTGESGSAGVVGLASNGSTADEQVANEPAAPPAAVVQNRVVQSVQSLPAQNATDSFAPAASNAVASQNQSTDQANAPRSAYHGGAIGGTLQLNNTNQQNDAARQNRQQQNGVQQTASQTVQVRAEAPAPLATESPESGTEAAGRVTLNASFTRQPVPSGLPLLSTAAQGTVVLAIDSHHAVFVSNDSGQHWKTVQAVWKGRAVRVEAAADVKMLTLPQSGASPSTFASLSQGAMLDKKAGINLTGAVTDQSGAVIAGAMVTVTDKQTRLARTLRTDANGRYVAEGLAPGNYELDVSAQGFKNSHLNAVAVAATNENVANVALPVAAMSESVTVEASEASVAPKAVLKAKPEPRAKAGGPSPIFEIVTDKGVHWTSADGVTWKPE
jgi:hypothetical protein